MSDFKNILVKKMHRMFLGRQSEFLCTKWEGIHIKYENNKNQTNFYSLSYLLRFNT